MDKSKLNRKALGALGERLALDHLNYLKYRILSQNWRCRTGEIDLVAMDGETLVFVEVRTRSGSSTFGTPQESVNALKQRQVRETAQYYAHRCGMYHLQQRFDVVSIITDKEGTLVALNHLPNAF